VDVRVLETVIAPVVQEQGLGITDVRVVVVERDHNIITLAIILVLTKYNLVRHGHDVLCSACGTWSPSAFLIVGAQRQGFHL